MEAAFFTPPNTTKKFNFPPKIPIEQTFLTKNSRSKKTISVNRPVELDSDDQGILTCDEYFALKITNHET